MQRNALSVLEYGPDEPQVRTSAYAAYRSSHRDLCVIFMTSLYIVTLQEASSDEMTEAREPQIGELPAVRGSRSISGLRVDAFLLSFAQIRQRGAAAINDRSFACIVPWRN